MYPMIPDHRRGWLKNSIELGKTGFRLYASYHWNNSLHNLKLETLTFL